MPYYYVDIPNTKYKAAVRGWARAMNIARSLAQYTRRYAHIYLSDRYGKKGRLKLRVAPATHITPKFPLKGLGGPLTEWACDSSAHADDWRVRMGSVMSTGATAAVIGAGAAGLLGGLLKRPLLGAFIGAATGWAAHAIWTAPLQAGD